MGHNFLNFAMKKAPTLVNMCGHFCNLSVSSSLYFYYFSSLIVVILKSTDYSGLGGGSGVGNNGECHV